jgi:uncharacterized membrane protein
MIIRLIVSWFVLTLGFFVINYVMDKEEKAWTGLWSKRMAYCGISATAVLFVIVLLERV